MTSTPPEEPTPPQPAGDPALQQALTASRQKSANGGISKATLCLGGAVLLAAGFFGGYALKGHPSNNTTAQGGFGQARGGFGGERPGGGNASGGAAGSGGTGRAGGFGGATIGTVSSIDGKTITVKTAAGKTVKVTTSSGTKVTVNKTGKVSDLNGGDSVVVQGTADSDGNIAAKSITEGGVFGGFRGGPNRAQGSGS